VWLDYYLSSGSPKVPEKLLLSSLEGSNLVPTAPAPGHSLIIIGNCPELGDEGCCSAVP
jgi:hypothetical protein